MTSKSFLSKDVAQRMQERVKVARGDAKATTVIRNAKWLDVFSGRWQSGDVAIYDGIIVGIAESYEGSEIIDAQGSYLVPGFIDAHVHVESSMMTPAQFVRAVLPKGTTTVVWDPHEIANVKGVRGIEWALKSSESLPVDFFIMVPSCVPSTSANLQLESSGASLGLNDLKPFVDHPRVLGLAEMMNWPGLVGGDPDVLSKVTEFQSKRRDGHCPGLSGKFLNAYGVAGIHSCHESTTLVEAKEKLSKGIHVLIREGSCAKDADVLLPMVNAWTSATVGYCSDDRNPLDIEESGHLDCIVNKALKSGIDPIAALRASSYAVAVMFGLEDRGAVAPGYRADLVLIKPNSNSDFTSGIRVEQVWSQGLAQDVAIKTMSSDFEDQTFKGELNLKVKASVISAEDFRIPASKIGRVKARVIGVRAGQIVTDESIVELNATAKGIEPSLDQGVHKIAVIERHHHTGFMSTALVQGINLKSGAIATSINHDCHNIIVTGSSDELMAKAVAKLREIDGGIVVLSEDGSWESISLPIGGLMTSASPHTIAEHLKRLKKIARHIGCTLEEPFLQLSFLALPVIPSLKISDRGLVDGKRFKIVTVEWNSADL